MGNYKPSITIDFPSFVDPPDWITEAPPSCAGPFRCRCRRCNRGRSPRARRARRGARSKRRPWRPSWAGPWKKMGRSSGKLDLI